ncbi:hypothetical protein NDU88_001253 [Pleurodeles waltl]|uniref:Uncharacterized protein n=1 Tax=Pleurodeles waltl TaxID=8319 RepID=A0AAV7MN68_PLEWA|nr:hypothetical protein NDU88_001253 [Pleurodeles waltl]
MKGTAGRPIHSPVAQNHYATAGSSAVAPSGPKASSPAPCHLWDPVRSPGKYRIAAAQAPALGSPPGSRRGPLLLAELLLPPLALPRPRTSARTAALRTQQRHGSSWSRPLVPPVLSGPLFPRTLGDAAGLHRAFKSGAVNQLQGPGR